MPPRSDGIGADGLIEATLYTVSTGEIICPISASRIQLLDAQDVDDQSYVLGSWPAETYRIVDGEAVEFQQSA